MKRIGTIAFYAVGVLAMLYLALYAYAVLSGDDFAPGDPIHIFRKPDAPNYSSCADPGCRRGATWLSIA